jgi:hypothetical protein
LAAAAERNPLGTAGVAHAIIADRPNADLTKS